MGTPELGALGGPMRLNRFLARSGVASRRRSDQLVQQGAVTVNGEVVREPALSVDPSADRVECAGQLVSLPEAYEYIVLHKPAGCLVTRRDVRGRPTVFDAFDQLHPGTIAVGRLDMDTTGLLLLTDDGELAFRLTHPRFTVDKVYEAVVVGHPGESALEQLRQGLELDDGMTAPAQVELKEDLPRRGGVDCRLAVTIHEGRKRQVRRMLRAVGHPVRQLHRRSLADLELDMASPGQWRYLEESEVAALRFHVGLDRSATA
jgi:23S rRNA pseudouridine2605 synthase